MIIKNEKRSVRKMMVDYLAYSLIDVIVDSYFGINDIFNNYWDNFYFTHFYN